jgi:hypothetical protein
MSESFQATIAKYHRLTDLETTEIYFLQFQRLANPRSRYWKIKFLVRAAPWFIDGTISLCHHMGERTGLPEVSFTRA